MGKLMIVPEFFAVGAARTAFLLYAVKGGGFMPVPPFDKGAGVRVAYARKRCGVAAASVP